MDTTASNEGVDTLAGQRQFPTADDLAAWLLEQRVDISAWGINGAKSVLNLWNEVWRGEAQLLPNPPLRLVQVVRVIIRRDRRVLVEASQTLTDGRKRERNRPPSEKVMPDEDPLAAARRCLMEEMGVAPDSITIHQESYRQEQFFGESQSYPGLESCYYFHVVDATVQGLPDGPFSTGEQSPGPGEPVSCHHWEWREEPANTAPPI